MVSFVSGSVSTLASHGLVMGRVELGDVGGAFFSMGVGAGSSYLQGGNPWIGAGAALMSYTLNQLQQDGGGGDGDGGKGKMKPASAYDYSQESIPGKWEDDWSYIT